MDSPFKLILWVFVQETIQGGVSQRWIIDEVMPIFQRKLAPYYRCFFVVPILHDEKRYSERIMETLRKYRNCAIETAQAIELCLKQAEVLSQNWSV